MATSAIDGPNSEHEHLPIESSRSNDEDKISREETFAVKGLVAKELLAMFEESLDDRLSQVLHNTQSGIQLVG